MWISEDCQPIDNSITGKLITFTPIFNHIYFLWLCILIQLKILSKPLFDRLGHSMYYTTVQERSCITRKRFICSIKTPSREKEWKQFLPFCLCADILCGWIEESFVLLLGYLKPLTLVSLENIFTNFRQLYMNDRSHIIMSFESWMWHNKFPWPRVFATVQIIAR